MGTGLWVAGADGSGSRRLTGDVATSWKWRWSPDGERIAYEVKVRDSSRVVIGNELWVAQADGLGSRQFTDSVFLLNWEWSPGGERIAYEVITRDYRGKLWVAEADGSGLRRLTDSVYLENWEWSPDGERIVYKVYYVDNSSDRLVAELWVVEADGSDISRLIDSVDGWGGWSSDGKWIAYTVWDENVDEKLQLWVVGIDGSGAHQIASNIAYEDEFWDGKVSDYRWQPVDS